jgi:transposase
LTSLTTSSAAEVLVRDGVVLGVERRRRLPDALKLEILGEVGVNGWTVSDVARRHDITRQHLYQWRQALKRKGLWPTEAPARFVEVPTTEALPATTAPSEAVKTEVRIILRSGRELHCDADLDDAALRRLLHILETS